MNTLVALVVDRSGSMQPLKTEAQNAINHFIDEQKEVPGKCSLTIREFDNVYDVAVPVTKLKKIVDPYILSPRGSTALNDAFGKTVVDLEKIEKKFDKVIIVVVTDGYENASQEWTSNMVKDVVRDATSRGWEFLFLAANEDAVLTGANYGVSAGNSIAYANTGDGTTQAYASSGEYVTRSRIQ